MTFFLLLPLCVVVSGFDGSYGAFITIVFSGLMIAAACSFIERGEWKSSLVTLFIVGILIIGFEFTSRRVFISVFLPVLALLIYSANMSAKYRRIAGKVGLIGISVVFFVFLNFMRANHDFGYGFVEGDVVKNTIDYIVSFRSIDTFWNTQYIYEKYQEGYQYYFGETYFSVLVGIVPRSIWVDKPVGFASIFAIMGVFEQQLSFSEDLWLGINRFSLSPGMLGEAYANFGIYGSVLVPFILGVSARIVDNYMYSTYEQHRTHALLLLSIFFLIHRGDAYAAVVFPIFLFLGCRIFYFIAANSKQKRRRIFGNDRVRFYRSRPLHNR